MPIPNIIWILPRPRRNRYQGGFPLHFEKKLVKLLNPSGLVLHPFGGMAEYGLRVDINPEVNPDIIADAHRLPFKDNVFGMVVCDPPYNSDYSLKLYNTKPVTYSHYILEAVRVCKTGGFVVSYHWTLTPRPAGTAYRCRIFIAGRVWHRTRVACVFQKEQEGELMSGIQEGDRGCLIGNAVGVKELLNILACPICKGNLELEIEKEKEDKILNGSLYCPLCSLHYPIEQGIPNLLPPKPKKKSKAKAEPPQ
jgi:uncharacterized protein YbaR (Trm112 family)